MPSATVIALWAGVAIAEDAAATAAELEFFEKRVRPVLVEHCQKCHGAEKQENGLRVDSLAALLKGGELGAAIVPGKPTESLLVSAIQHGEIVQMPPKTKLRPNQIADLTQWVAQGAAWPNAEVKPATTARAEQRAAFTAEQKSFWAFQSPRAAAPPEVQNRNWCQSPLDHFILAGLETKGLAPAPSANKSTLIRRATFDLLGIPPTPDEVEAFLADDAPDAWTRVVDRLLASPHYGERWGRHWLDVARYADSNGMDENVAHANAFRYRDYVIAALNADKPYDQFLREQLAGDLLADSADQALTAQRLIATGFLVIGPKMLAEDDPQKMEMDIVDEQLDTVGRTFLGLTLGCARCHDHKFDPLPTADYYSLAAIFKSTKTMENFKVVAMWHERPIASPEQITERDRLQAAAQGQRRQLEERLKAEGDKLVSEARQRAADYAASAAEFLKHEATSLKPRMTDGEPPAGTLLLEAEKYDRGNVKRDFETYGQKIGVVYNAGELPNFTEHDFTIEKAGTYQLELRFSAADSRPVKVLLAGQLKKSAAAAQVTGSWQPEGQRWSAECVLRLEPGKQTLRLEREGPFPHFDKLALVPLESGDTSISPKSLEQLASEASLNLDFLKQWVEYVRKHPATIAAEVLKAIAEDPKGPFALPKEPEQFFTPAVAAELKQLRTDVAAAEKNVPVLPTAMVASEGKATNLRVHLRGNYLTLGTEVPRQFPQILARENQPPINAERSGRLELANWMTQPDHPLTARVIVNRIWTWHFGHGIVRSPDNFGQLGERPDHPELLDYLAVRFVEQGWSLKELHRETMLSSTYQMSTAHNAQAAAVDPENRLHWRHERRRLEAEALRDGILAVSGELDRAMGGSLLGVNNHSYVTSTASERYDPYHVGRRSVYLPITRSSVYDLFQAFDFADPSTPNGRRDSTTVAPQALALLNSRLMQDQTRSWSQKLLASDLTDYGRIRQIYLRAFSREPSDRELARSLELVAKVEKTLLDQQSSATDARQQAWQSLCRAVLASSEFVYVE